jgi:hypothetical protein
MNGQQGGKLLTFSGSTSVLNAFLMKFITPEAKDGGGCSLLVPLRFFIFGNGEI